jgi:membrane fusion protein (multidrug efflux system)
VDRTKAGLAVAEAEADRASLDYERYTILIATNATSAQKLELATSDHRKAKAELDRARASVTAEELRLPILESERLKAEARLRQSEADLAEAEAMLALAAIELEETVIRAPLSGVVGNLAARAGQFVRPGSALLTVVPQEPYVVGNFKEDAARQHVRGPAGYDQGRRLSRRRAQARGGERRAGDRRSVQHPAARERERELPILPASARC